MRCNILLRFFRPPFLHDINVVAFIFAFNIAHAQLHYDARGTGRSTGIVARVQVYNPTPEAMRVVLGDCFIPAHSGHQGYVIPQAYPTEIAPFGSVKIELEGYCTLAQAPPAAEGWALPDVSLWTSWAAAAPLPEAGKPLGPPFVAAITTADDPLTLTYPGTQTPMPYVLDFDRYPQHGARLLLHAAYAAGAAFDQLAQEGKVNPVAAGRPLPTLRQDLIQQYVWAFSARLAGQSYDKGDFYIQLVEEAEQQLNQPISAFSPEERQSLERQSQDVWANVSLVGAAAKLIPPHTGPRVETLRAQPVSAGSPIDLSATLLERMQTTSPTQWNALDQLTPVLLFLQQTNENPEYQTLKQAILEKWRTALKYQIERIDPPSPFAVRDAVTAIGWVQSRPSQVIPYEERQRLLTTLYEKIDAALRYSAKTLHPGQADFLTRWRMLKSATNQPWYAACCRRSNSLQDLPNPSGAVRITAPFRPAALALSGEHWKHAIPITPSAAKLPKKFSWWIPAIGLPAAGGAVYFATRKRKLPTPLPPPPRATDDAVSLACGGQTMVDPLANDSGARITLSSINAPTGIGATAVGNTVLIQASGVGAFLIAYTITDSLGRAASANIVATVTDADPPAISCPPPVAVDCGQQNNLDITGQATATDICAGPIAPTFADNPPVFAGCEGIIQRTWTAADPSGNSASCIQTITVQDQTPPVFTLCPPPISAPIGQQNNLSVTGMAAATDACKPPVVEPTFVDDLSGFGSCGGTIVRNWTATDDCGNTAACAQPITVFDADPPAISCPPPVAVDCGQQNNLDITGQATATDNCAGPIAPTFADNPPVFVGCEGLIQRTWTAADPGGNSASCLQTITVQDQTPPVFTLCPPPISAPIGQQNNLSVTGMAAATDACKPPVVEPTFVDDLSGFGSCGGTIVRNWTATDDCGNTAACAQPITVFDADPPAISCPPPVAVDCGQQNNLDITGQATATDNCAGPIAPTFADNPPVFAGCEGLIQRTWTAADPSGNSAHCTQEITVKDHSAPVFTFCPPAVTVACGQQNDLNITGAATAQDACAPSAAVTHSDATIVFPACVNAIFGQVLRTFNAADPCGNSATCTQTISLRDVVPPTLVCPDLVQVQCGQQNNHDITGAAVAFDDCGAPVTTTHSDNLDEFVQCEGVIFRTFLSVDACGNTATCVQPIVVVNVPCNFTALFGVSTPVCGRCVGSVSAFVDPPGDYAYLWNTGHTTPNLNNVCPGNYTVTITHLNEECSDIYTVTVGNTPNLMLTVLQVNHPASPGASNGSVVLQVGPAPPWSIPPFQVFVNGSPIGFANTNTFQIVNMPPGEYVIWVVDQGGSGCMSSHVFVFLIPGGMAEPPALSLNTAGAPLTLPAAGSPEHPSALAAALWPAGPGLTLTLPFGRFGQMRLERQSYLGLHPGLAPLSWAERVGAGYRRYWPLERQPRYWLFSESALALMCLWPQTIQETRGPLPQLALGGGADASLWRSLRVEAGANLAIWPTLEHNRWQLGAYVRAYLPLQGRQRPMGIQGLD